MRSTDNEIARVRELTPGAILVAAAATLGLMTSYPTIGNAPLGLFVIPVSTAFGIGRGTFSLLTGLAMLLGAALTPLAGQAMDRFGVRRVILPGIALLGACQLLLSVIPLSLTLLALLLLLQGAISCLLSPLAYAKVLSLWFYRRRGLVLGIGSAIGIGGGSGVCVAIVSILMASGGWRQAYLGTGIYLLSVGALFVLPFLHEPKAIERAEQAHAAIDLPGLTRREAIRTKPILLLMIFVVCCIGSLAILMGHGPALLASRGLNIGPLFLGCAAIGSLCGQVVSGILMDRIDSPKVGLPFALASFVGGVCILHAGTSGAVVLPATIVMALGQGAETGFAAYCISRFCGLRAYGGIFGMVMALVTLSGGIFPAVAGYVFDQTGSYHAIIPLVDIMLAIPPLMILLMPEYRFQAIQIGPSARVSTSATLSTVGE